MTEKINVPNRILFIDIKDCFENFCIFETDCIFDNRKMNNEIEMKIINPMNARRYKPLSGSFANE